MCKRALANSLPYPVKKMAPVSRSFGQTGQITAATFKTPSRRWYEGSTGDPETDAEVGLSLMAIRFILRLIWPFSRII